MPIFDFKCQDCGAISEVIVLSDKVEQCSQCGSTNLKRLYSGTLGIRWGYPKWIDKVDDYQKRQEDRGKGPTLPHPSEIL